MALESLRNRLLSLVASIALFSLTLRAQAQSRPEPAPPKAEDRIGALEAELARQRGEIAALQAAATAPPNGQPVAQAEGAPVKDASDDQVAALVASAQAEAAAPDAPDAGEPALRLYGFADIGLQRIWADKAVRALESETNKLTFVLGNVNVYFDAQPSKNWRFLAEIRFGLSPDGAIARPKGGYTFGAPLDNSVSDPSAPNGGFTSLKWAGVVPERAHIDYTPSDQFNLRAGLFLTPYGIWNVDHGTPTRIMVSEPLFLSAQLIPSQLLGVEAFGSFPALPWTIGYNAHISNGRMVGQVDLTDNKAFGGRLWASTRDPFPIKLGVSGYYGTSEDQDHTGAIRITTFAYTEYAVTGDVSLDIGSLRVRSEIVAAWTIYKPGERQELIGVPLADTLRVGTYLMCAYQLPWLGMEPLVMFEFLRIPVPRTLPVGQGVFQPSVGLNVYFTPTTMLRSQVAIAHGFDYSDQPIATRGSLYQVITRLITAF